MTDTKPALPTVTVATIWEKPSCPQCIGAKLGLKGQAITPDVRGLLEEPDALAIFKAHGLASAPILQFPPVTDGDDVLYAGGTFAGNRIDEIEKYGAAVRALTERQVPLAA